MRAAKSQCATTNGQGETLAQVFESEARLVEEVVDKVVDQLLPAFQASLEGAREIGRREGRGADALAPKGAAPGKVSPAPTPGPMPARMGELPQGIQHLGELQGRLFDQLARIEGAVARLGRSRQGELAGPSASNGSSPDGRLTYALMERVEVAAHQAVWAEQLAALLEELAG